MSAAGTSPVQPTRSEHYVVIVHGPSGRRERLRITQGQRLLLGRTTGAAEFDHGKLLIDCDNTVSRLQAWLEITDEGLRVERHPQARTRLSFHGSEQDRFCLQAGEFFQVGQTAVGYELEQPVGSAGGAGLSREHADSAPLEYTVTQGVAGVPSVASAHRWLAALLELPNLLREYEVPGLFLSALCARLHTAFGQRVRVSAWTVELNDNDLNVPVTLERLDAHPENDVSAPRPSRRVSRMAFARPDEAIVNVWPSGAEQSGGDVSAPGAEVAWTMYLPIELSKHERHLLYAEGRGSRTIPIDTVELSDTRQILGLVAGMARDHLLAARATRLRGQVGQFFSPRLRELILRSETVSIGRAGGEAASADRDPLARKSCDATILFFDLRGFSRVTEAVDRPSDALEAPGQAGAVTEQIETYYSTLEQVMGAVAGCVFAEDGIILKYEGDAALACWGAPTPQVDHALRAARAARRIVEVVQGLPLPFALESGRQSLMRCGVGITSGRVVAGRFVARPLRSLPSTFPLAGSSKVFLSDSGEAMITYSVMGTVVNQAARLESLTKLVRVPVLLSYRPEGLLTRYVSRVRPAGMTQPLDLYELVLPESIGGSGATAEAVRHYEAAWAAFVRCALDEAAAELRHPSIAPHDPIQEFLTGYLLGFRRNGFPADWDGTIHFHTK